MGKGICMNKLKQMETALSPGGGQQAVDQMDNQTLLLRYKETGDMELKWALVLRYTDLVRRIAIQTCGLFSGFTQLDDVIHEGILVLLSAVDKYDPEKEVKFEAYIAKRLRGMVIDLVRKQDCPTSSPTPTWKRSCAACCGRASPSGIWRPFWRRWWRPVPRPMIST